MARVGLIADVFLVKDNVFEGGAERHLYSLAKVASEKGAEVIVYQRSHCGHFSTIIGGNILVRGLEASSRTIWKHALASAIKDGCTHVHFQYLERVPSSAQNVTVTATQHGIYWDIPYVEDLRSYYPGKRLARLYLPLWRRQQLAKSMARIRRCKEVLAVDTSFLRVVQSLNPEMRDRVRVILNYNDLAITGNTEDVPVSMLRAAEAGKTIVLVPRNLSLVRGIGWLPEIARLVNEHIPDCEFFVVGGNIPNKRYGGFEHLASSNVTFVGSVSHGRLAALYLLSHAVLIPTFAAEGSSLSAIEALSLGRPVIATNVGGLNDVMALSEIGLLVKPSAKHLAEGLVQILSKARDAFVGNVTSVPAFSFDRWRTLVGNFIGDNGWLD